MFLWAAPSLVRSQMGSTWEFLWLQHLVLFAARPARASCARLGAIVGGAFGTIAGLFVLLAGGGHREALRWAGGWVAAGLRSGPVQSFAIGLATDLVLEMRLEGGKWAVSSISQNEIASALGATIAPSSGLSPPLP